VTTFRVRQNILTGNFSASSTTPRTNFL